MYDAFVTTILQLYRSLKCRKSVENDFEQNIFNFCIFLKSFTYWRIDNRVIIINMVNLVFNNIFYFLR